MLRISNIDATYEVSIRTGDSGGINRPAVLHLAPNEVQFMLQAELSNWSMGPRQDLAQYIQMGTIRIEELNSVHVGFDIGNAITWTASPIIFDATVNTALSVKTAYHGHIASSVHKTPDVTNVVTAPDPTNVTELIALIVDIQTQYTAHIPDTTYHLVADVVNVLTPIVPTDLPTCVTALQELVSRFGLHKKQAATAGTAPLTPDAVMSY